MRVFWISWWSNNRAFECHWPWWRTGSDSNGNDAICAAICAKDEAAVMDVVYAAYDVRPENIHFRFIEAKPDKWQPYDTDAGSRFPRGSWMPEWGSDFDPSELTRKQAVAVADAKIRYAAKVEADRKATAELETLLPTYVAVSELSSILSASSQLGGDAVLLSKIEKAATVAPWHAFPERSYGDCRAGVFIMDDEVSQPRPTLYLKTESKDCFVLSTGVEADIEPYVLVRPVKL